MKKQKNGVDWWDTLSEGRQQRILQPEEQYKNGRVVSNEKVLVKIRQWLQK